MNTLVLVFVAHRDIVLILSERRSLTSVLVPAFSNSGLGWLWVQDVSVLGLNLYGPNFKYFWVCGLLLFVAICGVIAMTTPSRGG